MGLLDLPTEIFHIILFMLNGPDNAFHLDSKLPVSTACLCKLDKIYAKDPEVFPIWPEWKRDSLALSSVCKGLRALVFDAFWLRKAVMDWKPENLVKTRSALSTASCEKVRILVLRGDCNDSSQRPFLQDFAKLFPNLRETQLVGVYPAVPDYEKTGTSKGTTVSKNDQPAKGNAVPLSSIAVDVDASSPPISISLHRSLQSHVTKHEPHLANFIKQFQGSALIAQLKSVISTRTIWSLR